MGTASRLHLQCNQLRNKYERYISIISVDALNYHRSMTERLPPRGW
jgi:ERCC4-type nuclease